MSSNRPQSPLRLVAYLAGAVIVVSLFAPSALGVLGPIGVFVMLVAVYMVMFKRPVGRPPNDAARRLSGYKVRPGYTLLPEAVLLALAVWAIAFAAVAEIDAATAAILGLVGGFAFAFLTRISLPAARITKGAVGAIGLLASFSELALGDACSEALPGGVIALIGVLIVAAFGTALAIGFWKRTTLRKADLPSFVLAAFALLELIEFAIAPAGQEIITDLPGGVVPLLLVGGVLLAAALTAINPRATEAMLGVGVALGITYLLLLQLQQSDVPMGPGCVDVLPQLVMAAAFTVAAVVAGSGDE
jgi:hypothetical protein